MFKVGDRVRTGVYVCGEWKGCELGIVTRVVDSGTIEVDVMSLHGGRPWIKLERADHCQLEME